MVMKKKIYTCPESTVVSFTRVAPIICTSGEVPIDIDLDTGDSFAPEIDQWDFNDDDEDLLWQQE